MAVRTYQYGAICNDPYVEGWGGNTLRVGLFPGARVTGAVDSDYFFRCSFTHRDTAFAEAFCMFLRHELNGDVLFPWMSCIRGILPIQIGDIILRAPVPKAFEYGIFRTRHESVATRRTPDIGYSVEWLGDDKNPGSVHSLAVHITCSGEQWLKLTSGGG